MKPGALFRQFGDVIEKHVKSKGCSVVKTYCGHGINSLFHCAPNIPHYAKNKAVGAAKPGMCFTIEPMITLGTHRDKTWPDNWTSVTQDGKRTAQFGRSDLSPLGSPLTRNRTYAADNGGWVRCTDGKVSTLSRWTNIYASIGRNEWHERHDEWYDKWYILGTL